MSSLEQKLGPGHQQIVLGLLIFSAGAIWGVLISNEVDSSLKDLFMSAVVMLSGAIIILLGCLAFNVDSAGLKNSIDELKEMVSNLQSQHSDSEE